MNNHDICKPKKVVKSEKSVQDGRGMTAHVPHDHSLWLQLIDDAYLSLSSLVMKRGEKKTYQRA